LNFDDIGKIYNAVRPPEENDINEQNFKKNLK